MYTIESTLKEMPMLRLFSYGIFLYILVPMLVIILFSVDGGNYFKISDFEFSIKWYSQLLNNPIWYSGIITSLKVGIITVICCIILSIPTALWLNKHKNGVILSLIISPIVIPSIIIGLGWIFFFNDIGFNNSFVNLVIAHTVLCIPYVVLMTLSSLNNYDENIEKSARLCGANTYQILKDIQLPVMMPGLITGSSIAFITSFDEFIVALLLLDHSTQTLPIIMWSYVTDIISPSVLSVSVIITIVYAVVMSVGRINQRYE